jgi:hypothetical protein
LRHVNPLVDIFAALLVQGCLADYHKYALELIEQKLCPIVTTMAKAHARLPSQTLQPSWSIPKGDQMKLRIPKRQPGAPGAEAFLVHFCEAFDRSIPALRTGFLIAGLLAAAMQTGKLADFVFVTGLLLQFAIWFENWWTALRSH